MATKLIVESGSTKTDWVVLGSDREYRYATSGTNPAANEQMIDLRAESPKLIAHASSVQEIRFFGAGIIDEHTQSIVMQWLLQYFPNTNFMEIESDMLGAARSVAGNNEGIVCILGTGSNSGIYDGTKIIDNIPALGFALSNEGGGSKIGGELLKLYFYNKMPAHIREEFDTTFEITKSKLVSNVYKGSNPTAYLASFASFLNQTPDKAWRRAFLASIFQEFIDIRIKQYSEYLRHDLYFVGSIAYFYADVINDVLQDNGLTAKSIIRKPIDGLVSYYK